MKLRKQKSTDINWGRQELSVKEKKIYKDTVRIPKDKDADVSPDVFLYAEEERQWKKLSPRKKARLWRRAGRTVQGTYGKAAQDEIFMQEEAQKRSFRYKKESRNRSHKHPGTTYQNKHPADPTKQEGTYGIHTKGESGQKSPGRWTDIPQDAVVKAAVRTAKKTARFFRENLMRKEKSQEQLREEAKISYQNGSGKEGKGTAFLGLLMLPKLGTMAAQFFIQSVIPAVLLLLLLAVLCIPILLLGALAGIFGGAGTSRTYLQDPVCYLSAKYESHGDCGSIGSGGMGEYGFDKDYSLVDFVAYCYEKDPVTYAGFAPYLDASGNEMYYSMDFCALWKRLATEEKVIFEADQTMYTYDHYFLPAATLYTSRYGYDFVHAPDAVKACVTSFSIRDGAATAARYFSGTTKESDAETIIKTAYARMQEKRPIGTVSGPRWVDEEADCLALLDGTLDIYEPDTSPSGYGGIDWSWKREGAANGDIASLALSKVGCSYDQGNRDGEGTYDCSSLVYRLYAQAGIGYLSGMSAAEEARYLESHGMGITEDMLKPGDLIFYSYKQNGRYKNISHVAIYIGDGKMVHAANPSRGVVCDPYRASNIGVYARPQ